MAIYNPYRTRPDDETVTQPNFGGVRSVSFTDPTNISRDRALADSLRQQSMIPLNMTTAGGHVIPPSPIQGVAKLGEALVAGLTERRAKQKEEANKQLRSDAVAKALRLQQEGVRDKFEGNVVPNYAFGGSTRREATRPDILGALAEGGPKMEELIAESQIKNLLADASGSTGSIPAAIQIHEYLEKLPEDEAKRFRSNRFANKVFKTGDKIYVPNAEGGHDVYDINLNPDQTISHLQDKKDINVQEEVEKVEKTTGPKAEQAKRIKEEELGVEREQDLKENKTKIESILDASTSKTEMLSDLIGEAKEMANFMTTGWVGSKIKHVAGTPAFDLQEKLDTIRANIGFDKLQEMRSMSKTGGALGQVSEFENKLLQSVFGSLEQSQSKSQFIENLERVEKQVKESWERINEAYQKDYGDDVIYLD